MAARRDQSATYDRMMAEIQLDSDEDEQQVRRVQVRTKQLETRGRSAGLFPSSDSQVERKATFSARNESRGETKPSPDSSTTSDADLESTGNSEEDRIATAKSGARWATMAEQNRNSKSGDSEDSDNDQEASVKNIRVDQFKSQNSLAKSPAAVAGNRIEINALRSFLTRAPKLGSKAIRSGSEYIVYDDGLSPSKTALESSVRHILGIIEFAYDEMGPGRMNIRIPKVQESGLAPSLWKDPELEQGGVSARKALEEKIVSNSMYLRNKRPQFDVKTGGHVLDFQGRVTMASVKNFQVQCDHPLSPIQAFAICLSTLDSKFADLKLYDNMTKLVKRK